MDVLTFIGEYIATNHVAPSIEEIRDMLGVASKYGARKHIAWLVENGYLYKMEHYARGLSLTAMGREALQQ